MTYISWTCPYQSLSIMQFNNTQQAALSPIFIALGRRREKLESKYIPCSYECDSLHLGTLLKSTKIHGLSMYLVPPYPGVAIKGAVRCFIGINHLKSSCAVPGRRVSWIKQPAWPKLWGVQPAWYERTKWIVYCYLSTRQPSFWNKPPCSAKHFFYHSSLAFLTL